MINQGNNILLLLIPMLPLYGFILIFCFGKYFDSLNIYGRLKIHSLVACSTIGTSFLISLFLFVGISAEDNNSTTYYLADWMQIGNFSVALKLAFDRLSSVMCLIITGVGFLIHLYSVGYMESENKAFRYFSYLNLFCFFMLLLVLSSNVVLLFFGWEGVGLCSFLLIGYWFNESFRSAAAKKAFITNRVGDLFFLLGTFLLFKTFGTFEFSEIRELVSDSPSKFAVGSSVALICLFYFIGATGKSAQIPLYVWLPDAMAGPTPVSALIHAATMVTAGVYLVARLNFLFDLSPMILTLVAYTGAFTALMAALIALVQSDIKKILAYSTVSQLGFMFLALGVGNYSAAVFHLMTHAFFKALLFLGSGSVIHGCHHEQDIYKMGSLKTKMPVTFWTMLIGTAAIAGVPFFSGFFSKDEILYSTIAMENGGIPLFFIGMFSAFLTAIYMTRMMCLTFLGSSRLKDEASVHESPLVMTVPLMVLAALAAIGGFLGIPEIMVSESWHLDKIIFHWMDPVVAHKELPHSGIWIPLHEALAMFLSVVVAFLGMVIGYKFLGTPESEKKFWTNFQGIKKILENKFYVDELYGFLLIKPLQVCAEFFWKFCDVLFIDGLINLSGRMVKEYSTTFRKLQTGDVMTYASYFMAAVFFMSVLVLLVLV